jgi:trans-o-hydroxybenzylidenepyruvate hydratase-aldolase
MLSAGDLRGLYAIIPSPATAGADVLDATNTVDRAETARVVEELISDGCEGLIALCTTGECATLTTTEYEEIVETVLTTVNRRVTTFIGTTAMGAHEAVKRIRFARDRGAAASCSDCRCGSRARSTWQSNTIPWWPRCFRI